MSVGAVEIRGNRSLGAGVTVSGELLPCEYAEQNASPLQEQHKLLTVVPTLSPLDRIIYKEYD